MKIIAKYKTSTQKKSTKKYQVKFRTNLPVQKKNIFCFKEGGRSSFQAFLNRLLKVIRFRNNGQKLREKQNEWEISRLN